MGFTKRRDFLKWTAMSVTALPTLPLLQNLAPHPPRAAATTQTQKMGPQLKLALSRLSPYYLHDSAQNLATTWAQISGQNWRIVPQIKDTLLEDFKSKQVDAALISPTFYKNFPKAASVLGAIPHALSDYEFDRWLKSPLAAELREEIYSAYDVKAIPLGAFVEASGFYSRFSEIPSESKSASFQGLAGASQNTIQLDPFEALSNFQAGKIDTSHTLAHRQHNYLGLPNANFYYHESRGLRSAASFEILIHKSLWKSFSNSIQTQIEKTAETEAISLKERLAKLDQHYARQIRALPQAQVIASDSQREELFRAQRQQLFENLLSANKELKIWPGRIG